MVQKRQLADDCDVTPKHLKLESNCQLVSCLEFPAQNVPLKSCISGVSGGCLSYETSESDFHFEETSKPRTLMKPEGAYSSLLQRPPLKQVPIGPEYQADIPEWHEYDPKHAENKYTGSCIIPMPETDTLTICNNGVDCYCEDPDSFRCVQKHIKEARENLRESIGNKRFSELGFCNMGDEVACSWTEEDEILFHETVYSNPVSLGKNFWDNLAGAFPSRTCQEIVSYYFNVFVLQRRAVQNRCDPAIADSDDDEWRGSEYEEEDDDSEHAGDCDFQDDSCTSSEMEPVNIDCSKPWSNHDFIFEQSDPRVWDVGYFSFSSNKNDFLSTGNMIEEVFGVDSWNIDVTDKNKGSSEYN